LIYNLVTELLRCWDCKSRTFVFNFKIFFKNFSETL